MLMKQYKKGLILFNKDALNWSDVTDMFCNIKNIYYITIINK